MESDTQFTKMELRDYQKSIALQALSKIKSLGIVYLALQTRTGKTLTALHIADLYGADKVLFVTKKKAIISIISDYKALCPGYELTVINYESVLKVADLYDIAIIDESHSLSAFPKPSKRYKDLKSLVYTIPCILMSATPSPESLSQLFHQFTINKFHKWNNAKNFYAWSKKYVKLKIKYLYGKEINDYSECDPALIDEATKDYFISFTQADAGFTQKVDETILNCTLKDSTYDLMRTLKRDKVAYVGSEVLLADTPVKEMSKIHQLSGGTCIFESGEFATIDNSKAVFIREYFKGQKIVIFYKFKQEFELLKETFDNWTDIPEVFQAGGRTFLGQFQSAREGIRLDNADAMVFYNMDFSFLSYEQSKNRIISKERDRRTPLYLVFSDGGIERQVYEVVKNKKNFTVRYYGKGHTKEDYKESREPRVVHNESDIVQQKRLAGFDVIPQRYHDIC